MHCTEEQALGTCWNMAGHSAIVAWPIAGALGTHKVFVASSVLSMTYSTWDVTPQSMHAVPSCLKR